MTRTWKTYLLWLLIAAVPFQAFAAGLRTCASRHQGMSISVASTAVKSPIFQELDDQPLTQQSAQKAHCKEMGSSGVSTDDASKSVKHGSCSACAACSVGAFAPPPVLTVKTPIKNAEVYVASGVNMVAGYIPDSLKRPPRLPHF